MSENLHQWHRVADLATEMGVHENSIYLALRNGGQCNGHAIESTSPDQALRSELGIDARTKTVVRVKPPAPPAPRRFDTPQVRGGKAAKKAREDAPLNAAIADAEWQKKKRLEAVGALDELKHRIVELEQRVADEEAAKLHAMHERNAARDKLAGVIEIIEDQVPDIGVVQSASDVVLELCDRLSASSDLVDTIWTIARSTDPQRSALDALHRLYRGSS